MKRDLDLIRLLLMEVEEGDSSHLDTYVWQQTKATVDKISSASIVIIKEVAIHVARTTINTFTEGGSYVGGNVTTGDSFIGRDKM